ncbi:MAG: cupin domain-containing protein [Cyanobium sp.]
MHRHAHASLFVVLSGQGEIRLGDETCLLNPGDGAAVPRWVIHQSRNTSASDDLLLLAITDCGLTKAVLSDDDSRIRLKGGGADAFVTVDSADPLSP